MPGYSQYEISNFGQVFRVGKTKRTPVKVTKDKGYVYACLANKQINIKHVLDQCFSEHLYSDHSISDLEGEVWRDVVGWEASHEVSNFGRIRTKERTRAGKGGSESIVYAKIKETYVDGDGYERVSLYCNNETKLMGVHRIVAQAFVPNPENLPQVNHKNGNKVDNRPENLEWVSNTSNIRHSIELGLRDPSIVSRPVLRLSDGKLFNSVAELHREIGGSYNAIVHLLKVSNGAKVTIQGEHYQYG